MTATELQFAEKTKIELSRVSNISRKLINSSSRSINVEAWLIAKTIPSLKIESSNCCCLQFTLLLHLNLLVSHCIFLNLIFRRISGRCLKACEGSLAFCLKGNTVYHHIISKQFIKADNIARKPFKCDIGVAQNAKTKVTCKWDENTVFTVNTARKKE